MTGRGVPGGTQLPARCGARGAGRLARRGFPVYVRDDPQSGFPDDKEAFCLRNRLIVSLKRVCAYLTFDRGARLITGREREGCYAYRNENRDLGRESSLA
jgi:hypothetical protein